LPAQDEIAKNPAPRWSVWVFCDVGIEITRNGRGVPEAQLIFEGAERADMMHAPLLVQRRHGFGAGLFAVLGVDDLDGHRVVHRLERQAHQLAAA
jgi:hypothetical protein